LLERRYKGRLDKEADEFISFAVDGAKRMHSMIQGLLEFSRVTRKGSELGLVDLNAACEEALANLQVGLDESAAEIVKGPLPKVKGDASQLMRLLQNLIGNAIKYQAEGQKPRVTIEARRDEGFWVISVADNGIGIAPEQISHLFKVFQRLRARDKYPGFGLGLAICRRIVERHGGRIWAESQPGKGSTFRFTLPG
jgi:light-regulated signal transduction histidine kinase (bacteriophytochrome)